MLPQHQWKMRSDATVPANAASIDEEACFLSSRSTEHKELAENIAWIFPEQHVARILATTLGAISQVESVCVHFGRETFTVWTLLKKRDAKARERVYEKEMRLCEALNVHDFDFRVSSIGLVSPDELKKTGLLEIFRR
jgi:hypothetical protein